MKPDGTTTIARNHDAGTYLNVSNANAGTSAATSYAGLRLTRGSTLKAEINSVGSGSTSAAGGADALQMWNYANAPIIFATNGTQRMRIGPDGTIAMNYAAPFNARLFVLHTTDNSSGIFATHQPVVEANTAQHDKGIGILMTENVHAGVTNSGAIYGTHSWTQMGGPGVLTRMYGSFIDVGFAAAGAAGTVDQMYGMYLASTGTGTVGNGYAIYMGDVRGTNDYGIYQASTDDTNYFGGNVVVGSVPGQNVEMLTVKGNAHFWGKVTGTNIQAHYQDLAEWVPATTDLTPGTVVILNRDRNNEVMASATAYDTTVAGVVSAQPGISLGIEGDGKEQIATTGRVKVRVDARQKAVRVGDLLVTSDVPGTAMRSEPMDINGRKFHQPGTIIGKALEPLDGSVGEILVLLSMQ